jgi:dihydrofolate reductase
VKLSLIAAVASNRVIGRDNQLPWHLSEDLKYFKRTTLGKPVLMGRRTYESIGRPLPGRTNIVISRQPGLLIEGVTVTTGVRSALELAGQIAARDGAEELMVIGGAEIYELTLPFAQRLYLTEVHAEVAGDAWFPSWDSREWDECYREEHRAQSPNPYDYSFAVYERAG